MVKAAVVARIVLEPCGHRVLIRPRNVEQTTASGLIVKPEVAKDLEKRATQIGTVIAVGSQAWKAFADGSPWAAVGDTVMYSRYSGSDVPEDIKQQVDATAERLVVVNDEDVLSVIR